MHFAKWAVITCVLGVSALGALPAAAQDYSEPASYGDFTIANGQSHSVDLLAGGSVDASTVGDACVGNIANAPDVQLDVQSTGRLILRTLSDSDTTLVINNPSGEWICDDDSGGDLNALVDLANPPVGIYDIWVGEWDGEYADTTLSITQGGGGGPLVAGGGSSMPVGVDQLESGVLEAGDPQMDDSSYYDAYTVAGTSGEELVFDMRSADFDTSLQVEAPNGEQFYNDDYEGDTSRSLLSLTLTQTGDYRVLASSFSGGMTGAYTLAISRPTETAPQERIAESGTLAAGDATRDNTGSFVDTFEFDGAPGRRVMIDLTSTAFDTYLVLTAPSGAVTENDDFDTLGHSRIETELTETGTYRVQVTSYAQGETGDYTLTIDRAEGISTAQQENRDTTELALGTPVPGTLAAGDLEIDLGKYQDIYSFQGNQGQNIRVDMTSNAFDTYLIVRAPSGAEYSNDDFEASTARSIVELTLPESGRYQVIATSYSAGMTGNYQLTASTMVSPPLAVLSTVVNTGEGEVYGIFAGISDYSQLRETEWGWGDLSYTADDAIVARDALIANAGMRPENAFTFTDRQATRAIIEAAFRDIAGRIGPNDTFVFFYSGHGGQEERVGGFNAADADGFDETLALSDQTITDDEVTALFDIIIAGASVIILDSCYSGGFAKDVVAAPGRMGLFSSDEDVPSLVAGKFQAGGYLSFFFKEAVENGNADENGDSEIDAMELSQYLHVRYNEEAMSKAQSRFDTPHFGYQHLVVDRGGVSHDEVLFNLR
jgi:hypothetical protein